MKPGRVKRNSGFDWFTLLFEFPRFSLRFSVVVSFNGATSLILGYEFFYSGLPRVSRHLNQFPNSPFFPLESDPTFMSVGLTFPLVLTSAITLFSNSRNLWLPIPGPVIAQHGPTLH